MHRVPALHYLAYGSNLHPLRLADRVPSARFVDVVALPGFTLAFHKRGADGSGKCLLKPDRAGAVAHGALYEIDAADKSTLDRHEGLGYGYAEEVIRVTAGGRTYAPCVYMAQPGHVDVTLVPYCWYRRLVIAGARHHGFPADYVLGIEATPFRADTCAERVTQNELLLRAIEG